MLPWNSRPHEEAYLFNPAFCALLLWAAAAEYRAASGNGMPVTLSFIVLPVTLHKATRTALPRAVTTALASWLEEHSEVLIQLPERAKALVPYTRESLLFGFTHGLFVLGPDGVLSTGKRPRGLNRYSEEDATDEVRDCITKAGFIGRWFSRSGSPATVMTLWGVRP